MEAYGARNAVKPKTKCPYCNEDFWPLTNKQVFCSRRCADTNRVDQSYFGGRRKETIGLNEGICQLCNQHKHKGDEMQFTGLKDFLESKKPNEQVKKSEIEDFMRDNRIEVVEVVKSEDKIGKITRSGWQEGRPNFQGKKTYKQGDYSIEPIPFGGGWQLIFEDGSDFGKKIGTYTELNEAKDAANEEYLRLLGETSGTKFSQYQLEGDKSNYREILVTMPKEGKYTEKDLRNGNKLEKTENGNYVIVGVDGAKVQGTIISHSKDEVLSSYFKDKPTQFKSSHWDEPNILVHLRMNTRTDRAIGALGNRFKKAVGDAADKGYWRSVRGPSIYRI